MEVVEIKHRSDPSITLYTWQPTGSVRHLLPERLLGLAAEAAVKEGVSLKCADLCNADMTGCDLTGAILIHADMRGVRMAGAILPGADMRGVILIDADMRGVMMAGPILSGADLRGVSLDDDPASVIIPDIHKRVYEAASRPGALDMGDWHSHCGTAHCRAGWVIELAGEEGKAMERALGTGVAAALIYQASDPDLERIPDFYTTDDKALADMKRLAGAA